MTNDLGIPTRLMPLLADLPWQEESRCREPDVDPEVFFRQGNGTFPAKRICGECSVVMECREWALSIPSQRGVAGGLTESERGSIRRKRQRAARAAKNDAQGQERQEAAS